VVDGNPHVSRVTKEIATFERRTPKSAESYKRNLKRIPLGVASNYRAYDPYPIFVKEGQGSHFRDLDASKPPSRKSVKYAIKAGNPNANNAQTQIQTQIQSASCMN
jgi:hypothetical protein